MTEETIDLINQDLIKFPQEYSRRGYITMSRPSQNSNEEETYEHQLSWEEESALINIDMLKVEATSILRYKNQDNTTVTYALPKDKELKLNDDRFYTLIMLGHILYDLRRSEILETNSEYEYKPLVN
jgi:hypothetical protein